MENVLLQCVFIFFVSMVPFLEVFLTVPTAIIVFNFPPLVALILAILGNAISVLLFVFFGAEINKLFATISNKLRKRDKTHIGINPRIKRTFDRFGATGVCFLSSILFSSQVGAGAITTLGASRSQVFIWTILGVSTLAIVMATLSVVAEGLVSSLMNL
ncbi:small multi-drug export protein [Lentibacillus sp. Marseille-P4043]|uniref:small multi-drug export protein n=1 Tax=Lentibacillus sp. Marseille-P4043 TaxID=2040293 RepID=UPI000D0AF076|nr:small multi-drug export protein [Lentibacillus sp. Marseille-P4043]